MSDKDEIHTTDGPTPQYDTTRFGTLLRSLRESYPERVGKKRPGSALAKTKLRAAGLIQCLVGHGYSVSSGAYSELERGVSLPKDPKRFLDAVTKCLELDASEVGNLTDQLGYDIVRSRLGEDAANHVFKRRDARTS
jgi:hypothetical protein